jgi:hypothetical protein
MKTGIKAKVIWKLHPYVICPVCKKHFEVQIEGENITEECSFCHAILIYSTAEKKL